MPACIGCAINYPINPKQGGSINGALPGFCGPRCEGEQRASRQQGFPLWWAHTLCTTQGAVRLPLSDLLAVDPFYATLNAEAKQAGKRYFELSAERKAYQERIKQLLRGP